MTQELFEKAKFGDRFVTRGGQEALFLRLTENSEWQLADFYVKDWGLIRVNRENGKCLNGPDIENDIVGVMPSLPSVLDEAARLSAVSVPPIWPEKNIESHIRGFKAGAEWMAGQGVKAHCVESSNPVSDSKDENLHLITLVYAENENTPYVLAGDEVEIILRKKQ